MLKFIAGGIVFVGIGLAIYFCRNLIKQGFVKLGEIIKGKLGIK